MRRERTRVILAALIMLVICMLITGHTVMLLRRTSFRQQEARLREIVTGWSSMIEAIYEHESEYAFETVRLEGHDSPIETTISILEVIRSKFVGFGETGEFVVGRHVGEDIVFVFSHRHSDLEVPDPVPFESENAEPLRRALSGQTGTMTGIDYRGETVLAAYRALPELSLGIVAKIDVSELNEPFITTTLTALLASLVLVALGVGFTFWMGLPLARKAEKYTRLEQQLIESQRLEAIGLLAGGVAHDFNNILQAIGGYLHLVMGDLPAGSPLEEDLREVEKGVERGRELTGQLLAIGRKQILQTDIFDLNELVTGIQKMLGRLIGENIELEFTVSPAPMRVKADRAQLEQVLMNLVLNSRDAIRGTGRISVSVSKSCLDADFCKAYPGTEPGDFAHLAVADNGEGMDEETRDRVFEPFFTTKEKGRGTGLGLSTVYGIVRQHGGIIHLYSEKGMGTVFRIYLPVTDRLETTAMTAPDNPLSLRGDETILVAEDDEAVRSSMIRILGNAGYSVLPAADGEEAVSLCRRHGTSIDLAILDIVMPRLNGKLTMENLQKSFPSLRFIFCSGYSSDVFPDGINAEKDIMILQKPFSTNELLCSVRSALDS